MLTFEEAQKWLKLNNGEWLIANSPFGSKYQSQVIVSLPDGRVAAGNDLREAVMAAQKQEVK